MNWNQTRSVSHFSTAILLLSFLFLGGCQSDVGAVLEQGPATSTTTKIQSEPVVQVVSTTTNTSVPTMTAPPPPTITSIPTVTASPTIGPTNTATPTATWTPPPIGPCDGRIPPDDDLLTLVTHEYALGRDYQPPDLVPLVDYFPVNVTLGYPTELRAVAIEPLVNMIDAMQASGLRPFIISGYRSYSAQSIAWAKWVEYNPDYAAGLSARPGHSEHQLGTTIDFGSPELESVTGIENIEFHTSFILTSEGTWLADHAHEYGFTMSFPRDTLETTGFYYEPWHYRYIGVELATQLKQQNTYLIKYLLDNFPLPCNDE